MDFPDVDVFEYGSITDLEATIRTVYQRQQAFNAAKDELITQVERVPEYHHDLEALLDAARYVNSQYGDDGGIAGIAQEYAHEELDDPTAAENWDELVEIAERSAENGSELRAAQEGLWEAFGFTGDRYEEMVMDMVPFEHFLWVWDNAPHELFAAEDRYEGRLDRDEGPTMQRLAEDADRTTLNRKQADDRRRGARLDQMTDPDTDREPGWMHDVEYWKGQWSGQRWSGTPDETDAGQ